MAISDTQKVDLLWKKIGFGATKTDVNSVKGGPNEAIPSPLLIRGDQIWKDADEITSTIPTSSGTYVTIYDDTGNGSATVQTSEDTTATADRTWKTELTNWIPPEFGATYQVKVYAAAAGESDPQTNGTQLFAAGSGNNDEWYFDYKAGVLNFIGTNLPSAVDGTNVIYIAGARYTGPTGLTALEAVGLDSAATLELIQSNSLDSSEVLNLISLNSLDSSEVINLVDSDYISDRITPTIRTLVDSAIDDLIGGAPDALNTLNELAAAIGDDADFVTNINAAIADQMDSGEVRTFISDLSVDSAAVINLINLNAVDSDKTLTLIRNNSVDSADALVLIQDNSIDSSEALNLIRLNAIDSARALTLIDGASLDSAEAIALINATVDSDYVRSRQFELQNVADRDSDTNAPAGVQIQGDLIPATDSAQFLGSPNRKWKGLYVSGQTIFVGDLKLGDEGGKFEVSVVESGGNETVILKQGKGSIFMDTLAFVDSDNELHIKTVDSDTGEVTNNYAVLNAGLVQLDSGLRGPNQFIIDPYPYLSDSGEVVIRGDLRVEGITTTIQSSTLTVNDKVIVIADSAPDALAADGAGIQVDGANATILYDATLDKWVFNKGIKAPTIQGQYLGFDSDFDSALSTKTTSDLTEGSNLYYTQDRVDSDFDARFPSSFDTRLGTKSTTDVSEGNNLYYTTARVDSDIDAAFDAKSTSDLSEGDNLYYTQARVDSAFDSRLATKTTTDVSEGTNLYYTKTRVDSDIAFAFSDTYNTDNITEGSTNLYYTQSRVDSSFDARFDSSFDERLGTKTTTDVAEGTNLYYTKARVDSDVNAGINALVDGAPDALNTLNELAAAIGDDSNFATNINNAIAEKIDSAAALTIVQANAVDSNEVVNLIDSAYIQSRQSTAAATDLTLGDAEDGSHADGAWMGFTSLTTLTEAIDHLNEAMNNVRNDTFVRSVSFTGSPTSGGAGTTVTLNLTVDGNPNRYDVYWGDGTVDSATTDNTPSHTYATNTGSPYTVKVRAFNNGGYGTGMEAEQERDDYIIIYTSDPSVAFRLYRSASGGSILTGNDLYVVEGDQLYMENVTTNIGSADVSYTMNWGDGSSNDTIDSNAAPGGQAGDRLGHTWADGTTSGTSLDTLTLTLDSHSTADPSVIPTSETLSLKVYDPDIAAPDDLTSKTISISGSSGLLAANVTNNTSSSTVSAGSSIQRFTTGTATTSNTGTLTYNSKTGSLVALVNDNSDGSVDLSAGPIISGDVDALDITDSSDYNLFNASGSSVSFSNSIYHPGLYAGFKARVTKSVASLSTGINNMALQHTGVGSSNTVVLVKDDLTVAPTVDSAGVLYEQTQGTLKYISGIPHYTNNSALRLSGVQLSNLVGQTYQNSSDIVSVTSGTNLESTTQSAISTQSYNYAAIDGAVTMLSSGVPIKETGVSSGYVIDDLTININQSNIKTVEKLRMRARNINGVSGYSDLDKNIQVYSASISGIDETDISVTTTGVAAQGLRVFDFSAADSDNPIINGSTNYYTNSVYSTTADPGVAGTQEASIRFGTLKHLTTDYSGYLPAGPDRSGDTGDQFFTFAFRGNPMANFTINLNAPNGINGLYIAAPGTTIDTSSTINGWLDASVAYNGAGVPGAGSGGNGSNGCTNGTLPDVDGTAISNGSFSVTLGTENLANATNNVALVRVVLGSGQSLTSLSIS